MNLSESVFGWTTVGLTGEWLHDALRGNLAVLLGEVAHAYWSSQSAQQLKVLAVGLGLVWLAYRVVLAWKRSASERARRRKDAERSRRLSRARRLATYPSSFPSGWYPVALSTEVTAGQVLHVQALGEDFAVFRSLGAPESVSVLDAYCPHLGANMAVGGKVKGNCLECPFHGWCFDGETGRATTVPYCEHGAPSNARVRSWPVREKFGFICVYYNAAEAARGAQAAATIGLCTGSHALMEDPTYEPMDVPSVDSGEAVFRGSHEQDVRMHLQEFAENSVDYAHFEPVHGRLLFPFTNTPIPGCEIQHRASWSIGEEPHTAYFDDDVFIRVFGRDLRWTGLRARITFSGPGGMVMFHFPTPLGAVYMFQTHMPMDLLEQRVRFRWYADKYMPRLLVWWVATNWITQWAQDLQVWENKLYLRRPALVKNDGPVVQLRRWYNQFYAAEAINQTPGKLDW